jgi:hypothetical protein
LVTPSAASPLLSRLADLNSPDPARTNTPFERARADAATFIDQYVWLVPKEGGKPERFRLWDFQRDVLTDMREHTNLVILKARQLGLSWLALAEMLWLCNCHEYQTGLIVNRGLAHSKDLLKRIQFMHAHLPDGLRTELTDKAFASDDPHITFANGSIIHSLPGGDDVGSGLTAQRILADEVAKWTKFSPREAFTALLATLAGGGTFTAISTAKGTSNYFAELWAGAQPGAETPNGYWPIFIPSTAHPDRDDEWLESEARKYPDRRRFLQEHPEQPRDAFQLPDEAVFSEFDRVEHHAPFVREPQWPMWRGIDFGYHHAVCYWIEIQADRIAHVAGELHVQEGTTEELAVQIAQDDTLFGLEPNEAPAGVDPAGKARTSQAGEETEILTLRKHGIADIRYIAKSDPENRTDLIKRLLREGRLLIDCTACPRLAEALEQAIWKSKRAPNGEMVREDTYQKDGLHEHFLDALGYGLINVWPAAGPMVMTQGPTRVALRTSRYGTSDFD